MDRFKMTGLGQLARRHTARHLLEEARAALVYLGIFATFAAAVFVACIAWLLVW